MNVILERFASRFRVREFDRFCDHSDVGASAVGDDGLEQSRFISENNHPSTVLQRKPFLQLRTYESLAVNTARFRINKSMVREELLAHSRAGSVCAYK